MFSLKSFSVSRCFIAVLKQKERILSLSQMKPWNTATMRRATSLETSSICKLRVNNLFLTRSLEGFLLNVPKQNLQANPENPVL